MRTLDEINAEISRIDDEISRLNDIRNALRFEKRKVLFSVFCSDHGINPGDIVDLVSSGKRVQVVGLDPKYLSWVLCHPLKKDGSPYKNTVSYQMNDFDGCVVHRGNV